MLGEGRTLILNLISLLSVILTIVWVIVVIILMLQPPPVEVSIEPTLVPTLTITPTFTPSNTPPPPTWTNTPLPTDTPTVTLSPTLTITPTNTITNTPGPTNTPSITPTPSTSPTPLPTATPTGPTPTFTPSISPFPYDLRSPVTFTANFANSLGCEWQGMGGTVVDINGSPFGAGTLRVHAFNSDFDALADVGSNSLYGAGSGWEIVVDNVINNRLYFVQLETVNGTVVSPTISVQFPSDCNQNAAILGFIQTR